MAEEASRVTGQQHASCGAHWLRGDVVTDLYNDWDCLHETVFDVDIESKVKRIQG